MNGSMRASHLQAEFNVWSPGVKLSPGNATFFPA
jgi:hypothetical protein